MSDVDQLAAVIGTPARPEDYGSTYVSNPAIRESIARIILASDWLAERDGANRLRGALDGALDAVAAEREDLALKLRLEHWLTNAEKWGIGRNVPICGRCRHGDGVPMRWPCPTLQVLGWPEPPELTAGDMRHTVDDIRYHAVPPQVTP